MTIMEFNQMPLEEKKVNLFKVCGSAEWVNKMLEVPPSEDMIDLFQNAEQCWNECSESDWKEAFNHHPPIGSAAIHEEENTSADWARNEQAKVNDAPADIKQQLADANREYREKFGYIFIINATGKSAEAILAQLMVRLQNSPEAEIEIAMAEQMGITRIRLEKLLQET
jgi:2-oxo-4-hydroxy-4-carboxy-5-ureidoimidazoline decarboxylase